MHTTTANMVVVGSFTKQVLKYQYCSISIVALCGALARGIGIVADVFIPSNTFRGYGFVTLDKFKAADRDLTHVIRGVETNIAEVSPRSWNAVAGLFVIHILYIYFILLLTEMKFIISSLHIFNATHNHTGYRRVYSE